MYSGGMGFEIESEETFALGKEGNKIPRYIIEAKDEDFYINASKIVNEDEVEFNFAWPTEKQIYDYAEVLQEEFQDEDFEIEIFYLDKGEVQRGNISVKAATDGWNKVQLDDEEITVYEINNAISEPRDGYGIGWSQGIKGPKEMHLHFLQPEYRTIADWIGHDRPQLPQEDLEAMIEAIEDELGDYEFDKEVDDIEAADLLE